MTGGGKFTGDGGCGLVAKSYPTLVTPWTVAHQAPLPIEFSRHQYWSRLPFPSPGDLLDPGIKPGSPVLQVDSLPTELGEKTYSQGLFFAWPLQTSSGSSDSPVQTTARYSLGGISEV